MTRTWSLASRLAVWFTISAFLLILITTTVLYWSLARTLNIEDSLLISDKVHTMIHLLDSDPNLHGIKERVEKEWGTRQFERVYVKILDHNGVAMTSSPDFDSLSKEVFAGIPVFSAEDNRKAIGRRDPDTGKFFKVEIIQARAGKPSPQERTIQIALDRTREESFLATYRSRLFLVLFATLFVTAFIGRRMAVRGIRPVSDIAAAAKKIRSTTLHERINLSRVPAELVVLANTFNEMLDRLNESFERLSRFSQDIAHDLRTPINNLRGTLEVALGRPRSPAEYEDVLGSCLEECERLSHLIDNLLFLARAENPSAQLSIEEINIRDTVLGLSEFFEASATEAGLELRIQVPERLSFRADRALIQRALGNLITNAVHYTEKGGQITIAAESSGPDVRIEIEDTGVGIAQAHLPKVFDRFYRVDESRSADSGGSGLGLSIVKSIMTLHRGKVDISSELGKGTKISLVFPASL